MVKDSRVGIWKGDTPISKALFHWNLTLMLSPPKPSLGFRLPSQSRQLVNRLLLSFLSLTSQHGNTQNDEKAAVLRDPSHAKRGTLSGTITSSALNESEIFCPFWLFLFTSFFQVVHARLVLDVSFSSTALPEKPNFSSTYISRSFQSFCTFNFQKFPSSYNCDNWREKS